MPTVAASYFGMQQQHDARTAAAHGFLLDAGELCGHACFDLAGVMGSCMQLSADSHGAAADSLLSSLAYSDDALSAGASHANGAAAMQFLLLDDDELAAVAMAADQAHAKDAATDSHGSTLEAAPMAAPMPSMPSMMRQCSANSSDATRASLPYAVSSGLLSDSDLYCLAVVDEVTGLPLRPATPEETWEVERCFVLQQQSELLAVNLPLEPLALQHQGSAAAESLGPVAGQATEAFTEQPVADVATCVDGGGGGGIAVQDVVHEQEAGKEEEGRCGKEAAPAARTGGSSTRRPDQPRRCGPCDNCGATESPQWRQGPPAKPLLCNACGMRFRRTNQLVAGETGASGSRGGVRAAKKPAALLAAPSPAASASLEQRQRVKSLKSHVAPPLVAPDAKRPRRAAAVAAAATFAAIDIV